MEVAKPFFRLTADQFSLDFLENFDLRKDVSPYAEKNMPNWMYALRAVTGCLQSVKKDAETEIGQLIMTCQAMNLRSVQCSRLQFILGIYAWSTGTSKQTVQVCSTAGLSISHPTIMKTLDIVAEQAVDFTSSLSYDPHNNTCDNIDMSGSEHVEQCHEADHEDMHIEPILKNLRKVIPLQISNVQPTQIQLESYCHQTIINIIRALPWQYVFSPLRVTTIEEKSTQGNLENKDDFYIWQMGRDPMDPKLSKYAVPSFQDQLTNARVRGCVVARQGDLNNWLHHIIFQLGLAIFHLLMNLIWGLQIHYYGNSSEPGSLAYFFLILDKKQLAGEKPDYHALSMALMQILNGILLAGWRKECGFPSLEEFAASNPSSDALESIAARIYSKYCTSMPPTHKKSPIPARSKKSSMAAPETSPTIANTSSTAALKPKAKSKTKSTPETEIEPDPCHQNIRLLAQDLLVQ
ncbi:hypothetical protein BT96DRAFT_1007113 [Gymnopus androsaceus JB14]|uniref:DUF6589 domain-containing protein n=1 Tax=Gymnopus androsaceus JB14 TaxID=1447944 RepID=A0A6A4GJ71_9AGAR|nr:hypothetical protein BT96DRAFT_1007113 [Gymnopus androsaceus JB14]